MKFSKNVICEFDKVRVDAHVCKLRDTPAAVFWQVTSNVHHALRCAVRLVTHVGFGWVLSAVYGTALRMVCRVVVCAM